MKFSITFIFSIYSQPSSIFPRKLTAIFLVENLELAAEVVAEDGPGGVCDGVGDVGEAIEVVGDAVCGELGGGGHGGIAAERERERERDGLKESRRSRSETKGVTRLGNERGRQNLRRRRRPTSVEREVSLRQHR